MREKVLIAGTGLAAITAALRLQHAGFEVSLIEKNDRPGGRLNRLELDGYTFDTGPTFFSMSYEFEELAKECGFDLPFSFHAVDPLYQVHLAGIPKPFTLYRDISLLAKEFESVEPDFERKMHKYLSFTGNIFHDTVDLAVRQNFNSYLHYLTQLSKIKKKHIPTLLSSFATVVGKHFTSPEARLILSLPSYFLGSTPTNTNGIYSLLSYTEFVHDGYHNVKGGMYEIVEGLMKLLEEREIAVHYNTEVRDVMYSANRITALTDQNGKKWEADHYLINLDAAVFRGTILKRKGWSKKKLLTHNWSMGFLTCYVGLDCKLDQVSLHNYYIGLSDQDKTMKGFRDRNIPENPYFYVNVPSLYNQECAPVGCESLMFVVPVPNLIYKKEWKEADLLMDTIIEEFSERINFPVKDHIRVKKIYTPEDWQAQYNLFMGSGLGMSHSMTQTGYLRAHNTDEVFKNLYYTGSSTIPGIGLPMAVISSRLSAERIIAAKGTQSKRK